MLIHGWWLTPLCWEPFRRFFGNLGYRVFAPAWPGIAGEVAEVRRDPSGLDDIGCTELVAHYEAIIRRLPEPPIVFGHGYGGLIAQLLADRGLAAAAVVIDALPPRGLFLRSYSTSRALLPALTPPFDRHGTYLPGFDHFWRIVCQTLPESEARRIYATQAVPAPRRVLFQAALAPFKLGATLSVNFGNPARPPLLIIGGGADVLVPAALSRSLFRQHRASPGHTEYKEFPCRSHYIIAEPGWQEVADHALTWSLAHARA
ncbi:MAG: alpha/beta hydrolase [Verrucomicrobia bacterium]|nr:alpha/beta hydrolase [Verrucomicrobiota bacterium]